MPYIVKDKVRFLLEAGRILSSTLDYNVTLISVSKLIVDNIADFCIIDVLEDGKINRVVVKTSKKSNQAIANKMFKFLPDPRNKKAIYEAAHTSSSILIKKVTKEWIEGVSSSKEEKKVTEELNLKSLIFAPLISRGKVIGVLSVGSMDENFSYTEEDESFVNSLALRAGLAVDNSRLYSEAQNALRLRDEFLSIASHELKTPLTSILLSLQFVLRHLQKEKKVDKQIISALKIGIAQSKSLSALMNDLLNISVISTGILKIEPEKTDLIQIINDSIEGFHLKSKKENVKIDFKHKEKHILGMWDKIRIGEVFSNILSNALKYGKGKPIIVVAKKGKSKVTVEIKDKGIGISKDEMGQIFELFRRTKVAIEYKGMGVGLYISRQIIEAHGGKLTVKSKEMKGSTFTITLPLT